MRPQAPPPHSRVSPSRGLPYYRPGAPATSGFSGHVCLVGAPVHRFHGTAFQCLPKIASRSSYKDLARPNPLRNRPRRSLFCKPLCPKDLRAADTVRVSSGGRNRMPQLRNRALSVNVHRCKPKHVFLNARKSALAVYSLCRPSCAGRTWPRAEPVGRSPALPKAQATQEFTRHSVWPPSANGLSVPLCPAGYGPPRR